MKYRLMACFLALSLVFSSTNLTVLAAENTMTGEMENVTEVFAETSESGETAEQESVTEAENGNVLETEETGTAAEAVQETAASPETEIEIESETESVSETATETVPESETEKETETESEIESEAESENGETENADSEETEIIETEMTETDEESEEVATESEKEEVLYTIASDDTGVISLEVPLVNGTDNCQVDAYTDENGNYCELSISCAEAAEPTDEIVRILKSFQGSQLSRLILYYSGIDEIYLYKDIIEVLLDQGLLEDGILEIYADSGQAEGRYWEFDAPLDQIEGDILLNMSASAETDDSEFLIRLNTETSVNYPDCLVRYGQNSDKLSADIVGDRNGLELCTVDATYGLVTEEDSSGVNVWTHEDKEYVTLMFDLPENFGAGKTYAAYSGEWTYLMLDWNEEENRHNLNNRYLAQSGMVSHMAEIYKENAALFTNTGAVEVFGTSEITQELLVFCQDKGLNLGYNFNKFLDQGNEDPEDDKYQNFNLWIDRIHSDAEVNTISLKDITVEKMDAAAEDMPEELSDAAALKISNVPELPACDRASLNVTAEGIHESIKDQDGNIFLWHDGGESLVYIGACNYWENEDKSQGISIAVSESGAGTYYLSSIKGTWVGKTEDWGYEDDNGEWVEQKALVIREGDAGYALSGQDIMTALQYYSDQNEKFHNIEIQADTNYTAEPAIYGYVAAAAANLLEDAPEDNPASVSWGVNDGEFYYSVNLCRIYEEINEDDVWPLSMTLKNEGGILAAWLANTDYPADNISVHMNYPYDGYGIFGTAEEEIAVAIAQQSDAARAFLSEGNYRTDEERIYLNIGEVRELPAESWLQICRMEYLEFTQSEDTVSIPEHADAPKSAKWYSSDTRVASVNAKGVLTLNDTGETIVSAAAGKDTVIYMIQVHPSPVTAISLNKERMELIVGDGENVPVWDEENNCVDETQEQRKVVYGLYPEFVPLNFQWDYEQDGEPNAYFWYESSNEDVVKVSRSYESENYWYTDEDGNEVSGRNWNTDEEGNRIPVRDCEIEIMGAGTATITVFFPNPEEPENPLTDTCEVIVRERTESVELPRNVYYMIGVQQTVGDIALPDGYEWVSPKQKLTVKSTGVVSIPAVYTNEDGIAYNVDIPVAAVKLAAPEIAYYVPEGGNGEADPLETGLVYGEGDADNVYSFSVWPVIVSAGLLETWRWNGTEDVNVIDPNEILEEICTGDSLKISWNASKNRYEKAVKKNADGQYSFRLPEAAFKGAVKLTASYEYTGLANGKEKTVKLGTDTANIQVSKNAAVNFGSGILLDPNGYLYDSEYRPDGETHYIDINEYQEGILKYFFADANGNVIDPASGTKVTVKSSNSAVIAVGKAVPVYSENYGADIYEAPVKIKKTGPVTITLTANDEAKTTQTIALYVTDYQVKLSETSVSVNRNYNAENGAYAEGVIGRADTSAVTLVTVSVPHGVSLNGESAASVSGNSMTWYHTAISLTQGTDPAACQDNDKFNLTSWTDEAGTRFFLSVKDKELAVGTYKVTVGVDVILPGKETETQLQTIPLTVKVTSAVPKFSAKQTAPVNYFYNSWAEESWGTIKISASNYRNNALISEMWLEPAAENGICHYELVTDPEYSQWDAGYFATSQSLPVKLADGVSPSEVAASEKLNLVIRCEGYEAVKVPVTIKNQKKAYSLTLNQKSLTIYPEEGNRTAQLQLVTPEKTILDITENTQIGPYIASTNLRYVLNPNEETGYVENDYIELVLEEKETVTKKSSSKVTFSVKQPEWRDEILLSVTLVADPARTPALVLSEKTLTLNKNEAFESQQVSTLLRQKGCSVPISDEYEVRIVPNDAKTRKVYRTGMDLYYDDHGGALVANVSDTDSLPAGSYKFTVWQCKDGVQLAKTALTVKVVDQTPEKAIKMSQSGSLMLADVANSELIVKPSLGSVQGTIYNINIDSSYIEGWYDFETGQLHMNLRWGALLPASGKYTVKLWLEIGNDHSWSNIPYMLTVNIKDGSFSTFLKKLPELFVYRHYFDATLYTGYQGMTYLDLPTYSSNFSDYYPCEAELLNYQEAFVCGYSEEVGMLSLMLSDAPVKAGSYKLKIRITYQGYTSRWNEEEGDSEIITSSMPAEKIITYTVKVK